MKNIRESYKLYKKLIANPVSIKLYLQLSAEYNKFLLSKVMEGKEVTLPSRMGTLSIVGREQQLKFDEEGKVKGLAPDWVKTKILWEENEKAKEEKKLVYHMNFHTDNFRYKFLWCKKNVIVENKTLYSLRLTRTNKRAVHENIMKGTQYKTM